MGELIFVDGMKPGHGINVLDGTNLPNIAVQGALTSIAVAEGQRITRKFVRIDDASALHKELGVDVDSSGSYFGFSANAKMKFADASNVNSHSTYLMVHVEVRNAFLSMDDPVLQPDAVALLKAKRPDRFRERFGDVFINGLNTGGEFFALYVISGTDESEKESLSVDVHAAFEGGLTSAELAVSIRQKTESSHSHLALEVSEFQQGGADTKGDLTPDEIMAKAKDFSGSVSGQFSVPYSVLVSSYSALARPDDAANPMDIEFQKQALADAFKQRTGMLSLNSDIEYILLSEARNFDEFEPFDVVELTAARNTLAAQLDANFKTASACMADAKQCSFTVFDTSGIKLPKRKTGVVKLKIVPPFVNLSARAAFELAQQNGITLDEHQPSGFDDLTGGTSLQFLRFGNPTSDQGGSFGSPHTDDQIVVTFQQEAAGSTLEPGASVFLSFELFPGVPK